MSKNGLAAFLSFGVLFLIPACLYAAEPFTLTSTSFKDGDTVPTKYAGAHPGRTCGGENVSPQLSWSNVPEKTKSFAITLTDPEGGRGQGSVHWVAYGIPASKTSFAEGEASVSPKGYFSGKNNVGTDHYFGPCGPPTDSPHHYVYMVIATDLEPDALPPGLSHSELLEKLRGHALAPAAIVGTYRRKE